MIRIILFLLLVAGTLQSQTLRVTIVPSEEQISVGDEFTLNLTIHGFPPMRTYGIRLNYDTTLLRCVAVDKLGYFQGYNTFYFRQIDSLRGKAGADESILGPGFTHAGGALFALRMRARKEGETNIDYASAQFFDSSLAAIQDVQLEPVTLRIGTGTHIGARQPDMSAVLEVHPLPWRASEQALLLTVRTTAATDAVLSIHDLLGRRLQTLHAGFLQPGRHTLSWNGRDANGTRLAGGMYLALLHGGFGSIIKRILVIE
jgi:hypothetical protein